MSVVDRLEGMEQPGKKGAIPTAIATGGIADVEILGGDGGKQYDVVVEIDVAFAEVGDAPKQAFDGVAVERREAIFVSTENDGVVDDGIGDVPIGKVAVEVVVEMGWNLLVGDEEDAADEGGEAVDGGHTEINLTHGGVACRTSDVVMSVFTMLEIAVALASPDGVTPIYP